ncbi:MAG: hypothetical protein ABMA14_06875, partial [Hyphomonadaceae bacterium]
MRRLPICAAIAMAFAGSAAADTIAVLRENTLILHEQSGRTYTILIGEGSRIEQVNSAGMWAEGAWKIDAADASKFCWQVRGAATLCMAMPMDKQVGDTWEVRGPVGQLVWTAEIQEGRADLRAAS